MTGCSFLAGVDDTTKDHGKPSAAAGGSSVGGFGGSSGGAGGADAVGGAAGTASLAGNGGATVGGQGGASGGAGAAGAGAAGKSGASGAAGKAGKAGAAGNAGNAGASGAAGSAGGSASCGVPTDCPTPPACRRALCVDKLCQLELVAAGSSCTDDGNTCNGAEKCDAAGVCRSVDPLPTTDGDACTDDTCNPANGQIDHTPVDPNDGDACTIDSCSPEIGVVHSPVPPTISCVATLGTCAQGFHVESLTACNAGEDGCACATTTAYRQACAADCGATQTFCAPAAEASCPTGFHREVPQTCCGGDCAAFRTNVCVRDAPAMPFPTCEATCPSGYHPTEIVVGGASNCASSAPVDTGRRLRCELNSDNFTQCGTTCPAGYQPKNTSTVAECGPGIPNRIRCQK